MYLHISYVIILHYISCIYIHVYYVFFWYFVCTHVRYLPYSICIWVSCCEGDIRATCHGNTTAGFNWPAISQRYRKYIVCIVFDIIYMIYVWSQFFAYDFKILVNLYIYTYIHIYIYLYIHIYIYLYIIYIYTYIHIYIYTYIHIYIYTYILYVQISYIYPAYDGML